MPIKINITRWKCGVCNQSYVNIMEATRCEAEPVKYDRHVKAGDRVLITSGESQGEFAIVTSIYIAKQEWAGIRFWHSVVVIADIENSWGTRILAFDSYTIKHKDID